ncbi:hypothetical protein [Demequina iriomotensis]|uniref:hypothetical protein n=1 Tax=Demequina iriomotensis TaxID=1536641 RepID=UPI00078507D5|nr:hypothetical protein [Demequina iriomotensis]
MSSARPGSVTLVSVIAWLTAALDALVGAGMLWLYYHPEDATGIDDVEGLWWLGLMMLALGVFTAAVAAGLWMGSQGARVIVILVMAAKVAAAVYELAQVGGSTAWHALVNIVVAVAIVGLLLTRRAAAFFKGLQAA